MITYSKGKKYSLLIFFVFSLYSMSYGQVYSPVNYNFNDTPTYGVKIKTNLPFTNMSQMPTLIIEGFNYGQSDPTGLILTWYIYNGIFWSPKISSFGADNPKIKLSNEGGKVVVFIDERDFFRRFTIKAFVQGMGEQSGWFANWQTVDEPLSGSNTVEVPYENSFKGTINFPNGIWAADGNVGIGTITPQNKLHVVEESQTEFYGTDNGIPISNMVLDGSGNGRVVGKGPSLTFRMPANADGSNSWAQARILATPDNTNNYDARGRLYLQVRDLYNPGVGGSWNWRTGLMIAANGSIGIGTTNPAYKLDVLGTIRAKEVLVNLDGGADFVFEKGYKLLPIEHVANYVQENKHLPDIPSANDMVKNGVSMGDMQVKLLQKVEELTLYAIQQNKQIDKQSKRIENQEAERKILDAKLAKQENQYNALLEKVEMLTKQIEKK